MAGEHTRLAEPDDVVEVIVVWRPTLSSDQVHRAGAALFGMSRTHSIGLTDEGAGVVSVLVAVAGCYDVLDEG